MTRLDLARRENFADGFLDSVGLEGVSVGEPAPAKNAAVDARLTYWKLRTQGDPDRHLAKAFCRSEAARALFADFGAATFWSTDVQREGVHWINASEFAPGFFSEMKPQGPLRSAYLDDKELERISQAFRMWQRETQSHRSFGIACFAGGARVRPEASIDRLLLDRLRAARRP